MADEITVGSRLAVTNGEYKFETGTVTIRADQSAAGGGGPGIVSVTTSDAVVTIPGVTNKGWGYIKNLDATNYVTWGPESGGAMVACGQLGPGEGHPFHFSPAMTLRMQANTATCKVQVVVHEA